MVHGYIRIIINNHCICVMLILVLPSFNYYTLIIFFKKKIFQFSLSLREREHKFFYSNVRVKTCEFVRLEKDRCNVIFLNCSEGYKQVERKVCDVRY